VKRKGLFQTSLIAFTLHFEPFGGLSQLSVASTPVISWVLVPHAGHWYGFLVLRSAVQTQTMSHIPMVRTDKRRFIIKLFVLSLTASTYFLHSGHHCPSSDAPNLLFRPFPMLPMIRLLNCKSKRIPDPYASGLQEPSKQFEMHVTKYSQEHIPAMVRLLLSLSFTKP
jgi:hypothetical protein